jgi:ribosome-associated protein
MVRRSHQPPSSDDVEPDFRPGGRGDPETPSRSQRKRDALALQKLGVALTRLRVTQLATLDLPDQLRAAVLEAQRLRTRPALARQQQYIGKLMRHLDPAPIEQALLGLNVKVSG